MSESNVLAEKRQEYAAKAKKFADATAQVTSLEDFGKKEVLEAFGAKDLTECKEKSRALTAEIESLARDIDGLEYEEMRSKNSQALARAEEWRNRRDGRPPVSAGGDEPKSFGALVTGAKSWAGSQTQAGTKIEVDLGDAGMKTLLQTSAGWQPRTGNGVVLVDKIIRPIQVLDVFPTDRTDLFEIPSMEETTRTQAAAELAEGGTYAEDAFVYTRRTSPVRKIGSEIPVTDEQLDDVPIMQGLLNNRLTFGVRARVDLQVMVGDGTGSNLTGLVNASNVQSQAKAADSNLIAAYKALVLVRVSGRATPTTFFFHGQDWQNIRLAQNGYGEFFMGPPAQVGENTLWGLPVVQTEALSLGTGLCGSMDPQWVTLYYRKDIEVQVGYINTQFIIGQKTLRADVRAALWVGRGQAFCKITGL